MKKRQIAGLGLMAAAVAIGFWGYQEAQSLSAQMGRAIGASMPKEVALAYAASVLAMLSGLWLTIKS